LIFETSVQTRELAPGASLTLAVTLEQADATYQSTVFWAIRSTGAADIGRVVNESRRP
jgi:hypothetical protein